MKKVLITGGAGFIGSHIVDKLLENSYQVTVVDNLSSGNLNNLQDNKNLKFYNLDIVTDDIDSIFKLELPDYVIHLAAQTSVAYSVANPEIDATMNILGSIKILELSKKYNIKKFIAASSAAVYGVPQYLPIDEEHPTVPISQYGLSKLTMEKYIKLSGVPYIIFRFSNAYGPRQQSSKESGVIAIFNEAMLKNKPIHIYGDGEQIRDFVYVEDIANACCEALKSDVINQVFNFSTNKGVRINELFLEMKNIYNYNLETNYFPERKGEIRDSILSNKKYINTFCVSSLNSISFGIRKLKQSFLFKISVLMACYNSSSFLDSSINSVLSQSYSNWELICVNDFSNDNTLEILKKFQEQDSRIKIIDNDVRMGCAAPNFNKALQLASGDFIFVLGHDDTISPNLFENTINKFYETNAEIIIPDCAFVYTNEKEKNWTMIGISKEWGKKQTKVNRDIVLGPFEALDYSLDWRIHGFNLIKSSIVKKIGFCEFGMNGDEYSVREFYLNANKITFCEGIYFYNQIENSITKKLSPKIFDVFKTPYMLENLLIKHKFPKKRIKQIRKSRKLLYKSLLEKYKTNIDYFSINEKIEIEQLLQENFNLLNKPKIPFFYKSLFVRNKKIC